MVIYQQIENYILQPTIIGKAARISGFTVLVSVLAFGALFGLIGAIIGVPIAASIQIVVEDAHRRQETHRRRGRRRVESSHRPGVKARGWSRTGTRGVRTPSYDAVAGAPATGWRLASL